MNVLDEVFRPVMTIVLVLLIPYFYLLIRFIVWELRDLDETMHEAVRILKEMRDHQKGIVRKKVKSE